MEFLPVLREGGPWAAFLSVLATTVFLIVKGVLIPGPWVDKSIAGYVESNERLEKELEYWRQAAQAKDQVISAQSDQIHKLMSYAAVGTHALEDILREAGRGAPE